MTTMLIRKIVTILNINCCNKMMMMTMMAFSAQPFIYPHNISHICMQTAVENDFKSDGCIRQENLALNNPGALCDSLMWFCLLLTHNIYPARILGPIDYR